MKPALDRLACGARLLWRRLGEWSGDRDYERYLASRAVRAMNRPPLTREEFYLAQLQRRYSRPNRCC